MGSQKKGSAVILVIIIMSLVTVLGTTLLYNATLMHTLALQRVQSGQCYHAAYALLNYGIAQCKELDEIRERVSLEKRAHPDETTYTFNHWLPSELGFSGLVSIVAQNDSYKVSMRLSKQASEHVGTGYCLVKKGPKKWEVSDFIIKQ